METAKAERVYGGANPHLALSIYRLLSYFAASRVIEEKGRQPDGFFLLMLKSRFEEDEIRHLLVSVAAQLRSGRDTARAMDARGNDEVSAKIVGQLFEPTAGAAKPLTFATACNKILHATNVVFETTVTNTKEGWIYYYLEPRVTLDGSRGSDHKVIEWRAVLEINDLLRVATQAAVVDWRPLTADERRTGQLLQRVLNMKAAQSQEPPENSAG